MRQAGTSELNSELGAPDETKEPSMAFKEVLLQLSTYPEACPTNAIDQAVEFSELLRARISALTFEIEFYMPGHVLANAILNVPGMIAGERSKNVNNVRNLITAFRTAATTRGLVHHHIVERGMTSQIPEIVTNYARLYDLTILPMEAQSGFQHYVAECVIFGSGRPVLVIPCTPTRGPLRLDAVGVAWDFSRPAARTVRDAIPLLQRSKSVRVVTITNDKAIETRCSIAEVARYLAAHGIEVTLDEEDAAGRSIGSALEAYCATYNFDLLVMGAYGHSRIRDFILGGATKRIMGNPPLPVFLAH